MQIGGLIVMISPSPLIFDMEFPERLAALRKERGLTQQALADAVNRVLSAVARELPIGGPVG